METRGRHLLLLAGAVMAFAAMIVLVASGVTVRRARRDFTFGVEEIDLILAEDGRPADEAAAMLPWLAERAATAGDALRVLKRAHRIYERDGNVEPLDRTATLLLDEFPGNTSIRAIATFAAVRAGRPEAALTIAGERLGPEEASVYAWTLLSNPIASPAIANRDEGELLLAGLGPQSAADDFERAWRLTGDQRYALDGALILLREARPDEALALAEASALSRRWPLFVAGLLIDRGRAAEAVAMLQPLQDRSVEMQLLLADAFLTIGADASAGSIYEDLLQGTNPPMEAYLNLAWLADDPERSVELLQAARGRFVDWKVDRALVLATGLDAADLDRWTGTDREADAQLLRLQLDPSPDRRGHAARIWRLLEQRTSEAHEYAAWYFYTRGELSDVGRVLDRSAVIDRGSGGSADPAWHSFYRGLLAAEDGSWAEAARLFERSFVRTPSWQSAANAAVALFRTGERDRAGMRVGNALLLARAAHGTARTAAFLVAARSSRDAATARALVAEALAIDPADPEALLLASQLENPVGR